MSGKMLKSGETSVAATAASPADSAKATSVTRCTSTPTTAHASRFCDIARIARPVREVDQAGHAEHEREPRGHHGVHGAEREAVQQLLEKVWNHGGPEMAPKPPGWLGTPRLSRGAPRIRVNSTGPGSSAAFRGCA